MVDARFTADKIEAARNQALKWQTSAALCLAQGALESAYFVVCSGDYNYFGIKAVAGQASKVVPTTEVVNGETVHTSSAFASYGSLQEGFDAYGKLLGLGRPYRAATTLWMADIRAAQDSDAVFNAVQKYAHGIATAGYATDPNYVSKVVEIVTKNNLTQFEPTGAEVDAYQRSMAGGTARPAPQVQTQTQPKPQESSMTNASTGQTVAGVAETAAEVVDTIAKDEPIIATAINFIPGGSAVAPAISAFAPLLLSFTSRALHDIANKNGGDIFAAMIELMQHLTPGQPNSATLTSSAPQQ